MSKNNLSAVLYGPKDLRLEHRPLTGKPKTNEVLLAIELVGICGTDLHHWIHGGLGDFKLKEPMVLGHESSATVIEVGLDVKDLKEGDRVAIEPAVPCRQCKFCKQGRYNICPKINFDGPPIQGHFTRYYIHDADYCFKLPSHVTNEEGALLEPLSVGVYAVQKTKLGPHKSVLICGAGTIGLMCLLCAKAIGVTKICITDLEQGKLDFAVKLGATCAIRVDLSKTAMETAQIITHTMECSPDVTLECTGAQSSMQTAIYATESGGFVGLVGLGAANVTIPIVNAALREIDILSIFRYPSCFPTALSLVSTGKIDVTPLISHQFRLEDIEEAFETAKGPNAVKVVIKCSQE